MKRFWRAAMNFLLPPLCLRCDAPVSEDQTLCAACWKEIHFIDAPFCPRCGAPFEVRTEESVLSALGLGLCAACESDPPFFTAARSAVLYNDASRSLLLRLKHGDKLHPVPAMAAWMARAGADLWDEVEMIAPVPLHRWRLLKRRYNQAALLAQALGRLKEKPVGVDLLLRHRATESQGHKDKTARHKNVAGAFALNKRYAAQIRGKKILLVDDVMTSGATVQACTRTLLAAGAAAVFVLTFARTRRGV